MSISNPSADCITLYQKVYVLPPIPYASAVYAYGRYGPIPNHPVEGHSGDPEVFARFLGGIQRLRCGIGVVWSIMIGHAHPYGNCLVL